MRLPLATSHEPLTIVNNQYIVSAIARDSGKWRDLRPIFTNTLANDVPAAEKAYFLVFNSFLEIYVN